MNKLEANLGGIKEMRRSPAPVHRRPAQRGHRRAGGAQAAHSHHRDHGYNCDPDLIDYVIPGNDDAIRAVKLLSSVIANAVIEANQGEAVNAELQQAIAENVAEEKAIEEIVAEAEEEAPAAEAPKAE